MKLPDCLTTPEPESEAVGLLRTYYGPRSDGREPFDGRHFDTWLPGPPDRFTAEDILSVEFLNVNVHRRAFLHILDPSLDNRFNKLLAQIPTDVDFWDAGYPSETSPQWRLYDELKLEYDVGRTKTTKLMHRKRPRLVPIRDSVIERVLELDHPYWEPLFALFRDTDLRERLSSIEARARAEGVALPEGVTLLRVFDVVVWMSGITDEAEFLG